MSRNRRIWQDYLGHLFGLLLFGSAFSGLAALAFPDYLQVVSDASFADVFADAARFYALYILVLWAITSVFVRWAFLKVNPTASMERVQWRKNCNGLHSPSLIVLCVSFIVLVGYTERYAGDLSTVPFLVSTHVKFAPPLALYLLTDLFLTTKIAQSGETLRSRESEGLPNEWEVRRKTVIPAVSLLSILWILLIFMFGSA